MKQATEGKLTGSGGVTTSAVRLLCVYVQVGRWKSAGARARRWARLARPMRKERKKKNRKREKLACGPGEIEKNELSPFGWEEKMFGCTHGRERDMLC